MTIIVETDGVKVTQRGDCILVEVRAHWVALWQDSWPAAQMHHKDCWAEFDSNGLVELSPNITANTDAHELSCMFADAIHEAALLRPEIMLALPYHVACEQHLDKGEPKSGKTYRLTGPGSIAEGKTWAESEVKK